MDEMSKDVEFDFMMESLLVRVEKLARLETNKIVDKVRKSINRSITVR